MNASRNRTTQIRRAFIRYVSAYTLHLFGFLSKQRKMNKCIMASIKPVLNYRPNKDGRYTLILQILHNRRRGVVFSP